MPYMRPIPGFEPGSTTKSLIYYVNKKKYQIGTAALPGLIQDRHFDVIIVFFVIAVALEIVGLVFIVEQMDMEFSQGLMGVLFLIMLDILFAFLFHLKEKTICRNENEIIALPLTADNTPGAIQAATQYLKSKIFRSKAIGFLLAFLIWGTAVIKMVSFYALAAVGGGVDTTAMFIRVVSDAKRL